MFLFILDIMLLILLVMLNFCCGIELTGSERAYRDNHPDAEQHKHFPYIFHPLYSKGIGKVNTHVHRPKWTVMITKTVVIEVLEELKLFYFDWFVFILKVAF